jgi:LacI family transcriptional regulator/LacI family repressor for deo operon, udp, cdd, tsx, nupC, and nupG
VPVTIKDIARVAGVSHTTVSRALKGNPAISLETTARIQQLARQMGYVPSAVAQSLLSRRTRTIGMVITTFASPFIGQVIKGVDQVAQQAGYSVFLGASYEDPEREVSVVETFQRRRVDAIIVTASRIGSLYSSQLDQIKVPIVLIDNQEKGEYLRSVAVDNIRGAQMAVEHLLALGHRRIGYIGSLDRPKSNERRLSGYCTALKRAGLSPDPALILSPLADNELERGGAGLEPLLAAGATAVFCFNDLTSIGLLLACRQHNVAVPQQLSIIGFDDIEPTLYTTPPLTTIHQPRLRLGQLAMAMTVDLLNGQEVHDQVLPCELMVRESTCPPGSELAADGRIISGPLHEIQTLNSG